MKTSSNSDNKKLVVLVVDDQAEMRKSILRILRLAGFTLLEAENGRKAFDLIKSEKIDLVISDLRMPEMDGIELLHNVRKSYSMPFILITGFSEVIETTEAYEMGVDGFLQKPFQQNDLLNCINEAIESRKNLELNPQTIESARKICDQFCGIPIGEFLSGKEIQFPIFLKLSDTKFIKIAMCGEDLSSKKIEELKSKGIKFFYLLREDFKSYIAFASKITEAILASKKIDAEKKANFLKHSTEVILEFGFHQYVDKEVFDLAKHNVEQSLSLLTDSTNLLNLLNSLTSQSSKLYAHSMGVALVACLSAKALGWESSPLFFRVVAGGIMHDLGKKDFPEEILSKSVGDMSASELELLHSHPQRGADELSKIEDLPFEILQIVQHHHELGDGSGYPKGISSAKIHPVAKVIALADEFFKYYKGAPGYGSGLEPKKIIQLMEANNKTSFNSFPKWEFLPALKKVFEPT